MKEIIDKIKKHWVLIVVIIVVLFGVAVVKNVMRSSFEVGVGGKILSQKNIAPGYAPSPMAGVDYEYTEDAIFQGRYQETTVSSGQASEGQLTQRKVIKNGSLSLLVKNSEQSVHDIQGIAERLGGFVMDARVYEVADGIKAGYITVKVPAREFNKAIGEIKGLAVKIDNETVKASDVTEQFIDLEAQLRNLRVEEDQYLKLMEKADDVKDILNVASRLANTRGRIERIQGQLKYLSSQVDMSTIMVSLTSEADVEVFGIRWRPLTIIKQNFREMLQGLTGYVDSMIGFIFYLPILLAWLITYGIVILILWLILRWLKCKFFVCKRKSK